MGDTKNDDKNNKNKDVDMDHEEIKTISIDESNNGELNLKMIENSKKIEGSLTLVICRQPLSREAKSEGGSINNNESNLSNYSEVNSFIDNTENKPDETRDVKSSQPSITVTEVDKNQNKKTSNNEQLHSVDQITQISSQCNNDTQINESVPSSTPLKGVTSPTNIKQTKRSRQRSHSATHKGSQNIENRGQAVKRGEEIKVDDRENLIKREIHNRPSTSNKGKWKGQAPIMEDSPFDSSHTRNAIEKKTRNSKISLASERQAVSRLSNDPANSPSISRLTKTDKGITSIAPQIPNPNRDKNIMNRGHSINALPLHSPSSSSNCSLNNNTMSPRRASSSQGMYNKQELHRALPRKSFFNCHEKAMKDAGLEVEDLASKRRAERLKAKLEKIANEFNPLPSKYEIQTANDDPVTLISANGENPLVSIVVTNDQDGLFSDKVEQGSDPLNGDSNEDGFNTEDMTDSKSHSHIHHSTHRKKRLQPEKSDHIDCKPLLHYLEYVKDNQSEYENSKHLPNAVVESKPISRLISMGRAFELRHRGGSPQSSDSHVLLKASKALRPRSSDASRYYKGQDHDKNSPHRIQDTTLRQSRPASDDKRRQEKNTTSVSALKEEEQAKTELEKRKLKAEEWAMSVSTNTLTKAKIQSLRELGTDDDELTKWWVVLKRCHYLRNKELKA